MSAFTLAFGPTVSNCIAECNFSFHVSINEQVFAPVISPLIRMPGQRCNARLKTPERWTIV